MQRDDWKLAREWIRGHGDVERYLEDLSRPGALDGGAQLVPRQHRTRGASSVSATAFPAIAAPTMGIWSSGDDYLLEEPMVRSGEYVTGGWRYERIEGASHWLQLDEPERVNALLLDFSRGRSFQLVREERGPLRRP